MNESSGKAGKGFYPNTELGIDLKLMTKEPGRMAVGEYLDGAITHDGEDHFTFVQNDQEKKLQKVVQRNPHVYEGKYINVNRKKDGTLYPTFNRPQFSERFTFQDFWVDFKVFGSLGMTLLFLVGQGIYLSRHLHDPAEQPQK